jgi:hypothetical protein
MEKIKNFFNKHGMVSVIVLVLLMSMQTCGKNSKITKLTKERNKLEVQNDSLSKLIPTPENLSILQYKAEFGVYDNLLNTLSKQKMINPDENFREKYIVLPKEQLQNKIKELEK